MNRRLLRAWSLVAAIVLISVSPSIHNLAVSGFVGLIGGVFAYLAIPEQVS